MTRIPTRIRAVRLAIGAVIAAAVAAACVLGLATGARRGPHPQTYLQVNLCGNACDNGGLGVARSVGTWISEHRPFAVTLNEVCENQYVRLRTSLLGYHARFDPTGEHCHNGERYGNVILARAALRMVGSWVLPNPAGDELRRLMCVSTRSPGSPSLVVCVTHISNVSGNIAPQVRAVADVLNGLSSYDPVVLGGDFNADPADGRMDPMYGACYGSGSGTFEEADSPGCGGRSSVNPADGSDVVNEDTYAGHKYDYVFLSQRRWTSVSAEVTDPANGLSDHRALWATATVSTFVPAGAATTGVGSGRLCMMTNSAPAPTLTSR